MHTKVLTPFHDAFATVPNARAGTRITFYDVEGMGDVTIDICDAAGFTPIRQLLDRNHSANIAAQTS